jgi:hypothetical protein
MILATMAGMSMAWRPQVSRTPLLVTDVSRQLSKPTIAVGEFTGNMRATWQADGRPPRSMSSGAYCGMTPMLACAQVLAAAAKQFSVAWSVLGLKPAAVTIRVPGPSPGGSSENTVPQEVAELNWSSSGFCLGNPAMTGGIRACPDRSGQESRTPLLVADASWQFVARTLPGPRKDASCLYSAHRRPPYR